MPPFASLTYWAELLNFFLEVVALADPVVKLLGKESSDLLLAAEDCLAVSGHPDSFRGLSECLHHH